MSRHKLQPHVIQALTALDVWPEQEIRVLQQLGDGPTNETWLLMHDQQRYVLRIVKPMAAQLGLSLVDELVIVAAAAQHNLAAPIVASCTSRGLVLSHYQSGRTWTADDLHDQTQLSRLAQTLRRLHKLECVARPLDLHQTLRDYASRSADPRADVWADKALSLLNAIAPRTPMVCHNDLTAANIVDDGELFLIDWEYAGLGDPLFDLAVVAVHHELDATETRHFLDTYLVREDADACNDLERWRDVYRHLLALWLSAVDATPTAQLTSQQTQQLGTLRKRLQT